MKNKVYLLPSFRVCNRYVAVREPHKRFYQQVVDVEYESVCGNGQPCVKTRPEYKTTFKTVFRTSYKCEEEVRPGVATQAAANATVEAVKFVEETLGGVEGAHSA